MNNNLSTFYSWTDGLYSDKYRSNHYYINAKAQITKGVYGARLHLR